MTTNSQLSTTEPKKNKNELSGGMLVGVRCRAEGNKGEEKWDNCNSIINKIY